MSREIMQQALNALEYEADLPGLRSENKVWSAITAMHEALAEQPAQQEPVAWEYRHVDDVEWNKLIPRAGQSLKVAVEEIQGYRSLARRGHLYETRALYTAPPQRQPLTNEQIEALAYKHLDVGDGLRGHHFVTGDIAFARAIEQAHGIKEQS